MPLPIAIMGWSAFIGSTIGTMAFRLFSALGIGVAVYAGVDTLVGNGQSYIQTQFASINSTIPAVFDTVAYLGVDKGLSMIFASAVAVTAIKPLKWVLKS